MSYTEQIKIIRYMMSSAAAFVNGAEIPEKPDFIKWEDIYVIAKKHSLTAFMCSIYQARVSPDELLLKWKNESSVLAAKHLVQKLEFSKITRLFEENEIVYLPLKGFKIKELYPSPELREMSDIDICVNPQDFDKASQIILNLGNRLEHEGSVHNCYINPPFIEIELHRMLFDGRTDFRTDLCPQKFHDNKYHRCFSLTEELVFLLLHAKKHDSHGGCGARAILDFYLFFKKRGKEIDKELLEKRLAEEKLVDFYENLTRLISLWFENGSLTPEVIDFELYTLRGGTYGTLVNYIENETSKRGIGFYFSRIFPRFSFMVKRYPILKKCPILLPFLYIVRWIVAIFDGSVMKNLRVIAYKRKNKVKIQEYKDNTENT